MVEPEKNFCNYVKEQIVDEKEAVRLYDRVVEVLDTTATVFGSAENPLEISPSEKELLKALIKKIGTDENSHLTILEVIDRLVCSH